MLATTCHAVVNDPASTAGGKYRLNWSVKPRYRDPDIPSEHVGDANRDPELDELPVTFAPGIRLQSRRFPK
jgi:hypothetical protein